MHMLMAALTWNAGNINDGDNFNLYNKKDSKMKQEKFQEETKALFIFLRYIDQGPLITDGRNCCKWTSPLVVLAKTFTMVKISVQNF